MSASTAAILPFGLKDRWSAAVESEWHFVKVRHRNRWYAVARRRGHQDRRHWCATRADAVGTAEYMREGFREMEERLWFSRLYGRSNEWQRAQFHEYLKTPGGRE